MKENILVTGLNLKPRNFDRASQKIDEVVLAGAEWMRYCFSTVCLCLCACRCRMDEVLLLL